MTEWPSGCHDPDSCAKHEHCMYIRCRHEHMSAEDFREAIERERLQAEAWEMAQEMMKRAAERAADPSPPTDFELMERSIQRLREIAAQDMPPILLKREADQIERLLASIRAAAPARSL